MDLAKVLIMVNEVRQFSLPVDDVASGADGTGKRTRATTENTNFAHL